MKIYLYDRNGKTEILFSDDPPNQKMYGTPFRIICLSGGINCNNFEILLNGKVVAERTTSRSDHD